MIIVQNHAFLQQLLRLPSVEYALLSPDGRWVAFMWYRKHPNCDVFRVPADGSGQPVALTHTPEFTRLVSWAPDSRAVIVEEDHNKDEFVRLFRVDLDHPEQMRPLTEDRPPYFIRGGSLHPEGSTLFYGANYDFSGKKLLGSSWIYRHDLHTGERLAIARPLRPAYMEVSLNRSGTHLLYCRKDRHAAGRQFWLVDVEGKEDIEILNFGDDVKVSASWFPDGENILVVSESMNTSPRLHLRLGVYHWPTQHLRWLMDDPKRFLEGAWVSPDGGIIVDEIIRGNHAATLLDPESGVETPFPRMPGNLIPLGRAADGVWVALYYAATDPAELVLFSQEATSQADLTSLTQTWKHTSLLKEHLVATEAIHWNSVDGLEVFGWLYRARPNHGRAVIHIHGGPTLHSENRLNTQIQYLASQRFNVLDVNYRGSTGHGFLFKEAIKEDGWGGREQADIATGAEALIRAGLAGPGQIGVTGTSFGGYSAWFLLAHYPTDIIAAAAPICGMTDLILDYETTRPDLRPYSEEMIGGRPDQIPEKYRERSPINYVQNIRGHLLIVQGAQDPNVTPENVRQVRQRLEAHSIPYELLVFEDEGHGITKPNNQEVLYTRLADFFNNALRQPN